MTGLRPSCGACKFLRRKCTSECVFAPYFCYDQAATHFAAVHKVFGASNISKLLLHLPVQNRSAAAITISYEALSRMRDPVYGCVAHIFALQQQVLGLQEEVEFLVTQMANVAAEVPQISTCTVNMSDFPSDLEMKNLAYMSNQQTEAINSIGHTFESQMNGVNGNILRDFNMTPEIFVNSPSLEMDFNIIDMEGLQWK